MCLRGLKSDPQCLQVGFKGLFMRHLQYFLEVVNDSTITGKYSDFIGRQANAVNQYARRSDGMVGSIWWGTSDAALYPDAVNAFSSGLDAILASVKVSSSLCSVANTDQLFRPVWHMLMGIMGIN
jgi:hypothetical protein